MLAEGHEQTQRVGFGKMASGLVPAGDEFGRVLSGHQVWLHFDEGVIVETEISAGEPFFQDGRSGLQSHGGPFNLTGRSQQNFTFALEERPRHAAGYVLGEANDAVIKGNVEGGPVDGELARTINS